MTDHHQLFRDAFAAQVKADTGDDPVVVKIFAVAEVITGTGDPWLAIHGSTGLAPWDQCGLAAALTQVADRNLLDGWEDQD